MTVWMTTCPRCKGRRGFKGDEQVSECSCPPGNSYLCPDCGTIDSAVHDQWRHDLLDRVVRAETLAEVALAQATKAAVSSAPIARDTNETFSAQDPAAYQLAEEIMDGTTERLNAEYLKGWQECRESLWLCKCGYIGSRKEHAAANGLWCLDERKAPVGPTIDSTSEQNGGNDEADQSVPTMAGPGAREGQPGERQLPDAPLGHQDPVAPVDAGSTDWQALAARLHEALGHADPSRCIYIEEFAAYEKAKGSNGGER